MTPGSISSQTRYPGRHFGYPRSAFPDRSAKKIEPTPEQAFEDTFPQAAWIDPITFRPTAFKGLNRKAQKHALAGWGFVPESPTALVKHALLRTYIRQSEAYLERKINDQPTLEKALNRLGQRLAPLAQTMSLPPNAAKTDQDEWHYN